MSKRNQWLIYAATGYSGRRIAEWAVAHGMRPVIAGRRSIEVKALAERLGLQWEVFELNDAKAIAPIRAKYSTVLNCAGPFIHSYQVMIDACLAASTHYLDITGEVNVYEGLASREEQAKRAGVMMMPAVGFDMVPSDCLAVHLKDKLPDTTELIMAYSFDGTITRGSVRSALAAFSPDTQVRRNQQLVRLPAPDVRRFDFGSGSSAGVVDCYSSTFGDISIAWRTTKIPNVTAYLHITEAFQKLATLNGEADIAKMPEGASDEELRTFKAFIIGEARNAAGKVVRARMITPQVYAITFPLAATIAQRVHDGAAKPGFQTPAAMFGKAFILGFDRCSIEWLT